ncbi:MAG: sigma-70 family RNA polymerase sigma factor [Armatimonadetes bacterium]|nr:sigma-70 family RNA polymerase sigma factor [Armatimonadota bacterium]
MTASAEDDARLVERCQRGDREALDQLVRRYRATAYKFALRLTGDPDSAADLTAEAFVRVFMKIGRFRRESRFSTWLYRILTNCFLDLCKRERVRRHQSIEELVRTEESDVGRQYSAAEDSPQVDVEKAERNRLLQEAILHLPEYQRAMIVMFHVQMLSYEEIAETLDMPLGTVKSRLNRARLMLREVLEPVQELFQV